MRNQFARTMEDIGTSDQRLVVLLGDISVFLLRNFQTRFPGRFYNIGICEQTIISLAAGLSAMGFHPVVHTITPFAVERCYEQIKIDLCYQKLGCNIVSVGSAFDYAASGCSHHCYEDFALLSPLPDTQIIYPASEMEFDILFKQTYDNGHTTYFRLPAVKHGIPFDKNQIEFGKGIRVQEGNCLTIVVTGPQLKNALLASQTMDVEIVYVHTVKPLDVKLIKQSALKTCKVLTVEEHSVVGGLGDAVSRALEGYWNIKQVRLGIEDKFLTKYGTYEQHCAALGLDVKGIRNRLAGLI